MQDIYRQIFEMAEKELSHRVFIWYGEEAYIYRGFRISRKNNNYQWKDARYSDYMEEVDPLITEKILELGFCNAITEVMKHTDKIRLRQLKRNMEKLDAEVEHWIKEASKSYNKMKRATNSSDSEKALAAKKKYEKEKSRFAKKRGVIKSEREALQGDINFYESRINMYKNKNHGIESNK